MLTMEYSQGEHDYVCDANGDTDLINGAVKALATAYGIHEKSVAYLLEYGWRQTLQDSFAGPKKKAQDDGESDDTIATVIHAAVQKRIDALKAGSMVLGATGGRDPLRSVAQYMIEGAMRAAGQTPPAKNDKAAWKKAVDEMLQTRLQLVKDEVAKRRASKNEKVEIKLDELQF